MKDKRSPDFSGLYTLGVFVLAAWNDRMTIDS